MQKDLILLRSHITLDFAMQELARMLEEAGIKPAVHSCKDVMVDNSILVGTWEDCKQAGIPCEQFIGNGNTPEKAGDDDYMMVESGGKGRIILAGKTERSTLYAVYEYGRRYLGCSYVYPDLFGMRYDRETGRDLFDDRDQQAYYSPLFQRRGFVFETIYDVDYMVGMIDWLAKNRISEIFVTFMLWDRLRNAISPEINKRGMKLTLGGHSMKFFTRKEHPDGLEELTESDPYGVKRQFDYDDLTWQTEVCERIMSYCEGIAGLERISLWPEDVAVKRTGRNSHRPEDASRFLSGYIRFTECLKEALERQGLNIEVEHIAYNAGLSWNMLERGEIAGSGAVDTLFAYWGRSYGRSLMNNSSAFERRALDSLMDWRAETKTRKRHFTVFEYYSDHFMLTWLFPALLGRMAHDMREYNELGVDGLLNLVVPFVPKPNLPGAGPGDGYDWRWAHGCNSFGFARLAWGDRPEEVLQHYLSVFTPSERPEVKRLLADIEQRVSEVTEWNIPLFPARAVDPEKITGKPDRAGITMMLRRIASLPEVSLPPDVIPSRAFHAFLVYVNGLKEEAGKLEQHWLAAE
ncbi:alpha-glucuronidase family glycosyl hydrolase [Paenibacillus abyssi]|uniref:Alpha glucuronidase N-terminal domain-containing protein n=1 Tax=Paenibacillus abyssi TaxID=1340531 RepID=A0A917CSA7_9BACL|nr:alpha-glucuronidase family glycosyl hydrolase [Paenibacillus abyssi]GGF96039.1 hypothetical protein GCM10010916_11640 [Paenibacillus abyssi]